VCSSPTNSREEPEKQAKAVVASGHDRKWDELSQLLQNNPAMHDEFGRQRKIIVFSEHRDTLNYLHAKIAGVLGSTDAIITIHGGTHRDERRKSQALFRSDPDVRVLVATDAAGEGVNLQCAHLMVNYDLPWNPNRLEQRFGRIHRIGQTEVCHLWSLVAKETREGTVWHRLLEKLAVECDALKGKEFNILGDVFEEKSLKELIIEAIRYGDQPEVRARLTKRIDHAFDHDHLKSLLDRNALAQEAMTPDRLFKVSRYDAVLEADGKPMTVRPALQLINRFLAEDDFDADTQFCLHWFEQHGWETGKFGEADTLARAKGTAVAGVQQSGVIESGAGNVRLLKWKEYPADWDPATDTRLPIWEALHQLIRAYNTEGDNGAALVLKGVEAKAEAARQLAYRLYTLCERRGWAEDARAYNEVVTGWSGIENAAAKVPSPTQGTLFDREEAD
jgi:hypothetical protein